VKVSVDADRCRGHGLCTILAPDVFTLTDSGYTVVSNPEVPTEREQDVREAAHACPERAITIS
jgi:ferredoxin